MNRGAIKNNTVALFYDGFEAQAIDGPLGQLRSELRGMARKYYRSLRQKQLYTGYYTAFLNLKCSLESIGLDVRVNDFTYARANPDQPIGISGYPSVFDRVRLPNPAVFGPGYVPPPTEITDIMDQCNIQIVTLPSRWPCEIWKPLLGDAVQPMFVSIDVAAWPDLSKHTKTTDFLIYDKVRWAREDRTKDLINPLMAELDRKSLSHVTLRYGHHHLAQFRQELSRCKAMIFLCEHETQGLAYQEALSSNVPVLAWDEGILVDPHQKRIAPKQTVVSSVPYFDERCGQVFTKDTLAETLAQFQTDLPNFNPRAYVIDRLNFEVGAKRYLDLLSAAAERRSTSPTPSTSPRDHLLEEAI